MRKTDSYRFLETGCVRDTSNWNDGQSTVILNAFLRWMGGRLTSVDISRKAIHNAVNLIGCQNVDFIMANSIVYLPTLPHEVKLDLIYLDSMELDIQNPTPSAVHHLMEFSTLLGKNTRPGTLVAIDDNLSADLGKGMFIRKAMKELGATCLWDDFLCVWRLEKMPELEHEEI